MSKKCWSILLCLFLHTSLAAALSETALRGDGVRVESASFRRSKRVKKTKKRVPVRLVPPNIKIKSRNDGMFSLFFDVLYAVWEFEHGYLSSLQVDFGKNGLYYEPQFGENWWEYYCQPVRLGKMQESPIEWEYGASPHMAPWDETSGIPRLAAYELITKYIHPKKHIVDQVEGFCREYFSDNHIIGVHYRGTDKISEAPRVAYENAFKAIQAMVDLWERCNTQKPCRIFIATDEQGFIDYAHSVWGDRVCYRETIRSTNGRQIHYGTNNSPHQLGQEAIVDMLLLSKSDVLIRTSSNLSLWSTYFNPTVPVIELSQRH